MHHIERRVANLEEATAYPDKPVRLVWAAEGEDQAKGRDKASQELPGFKIKVVSWLPATAR